MRKALVPPKYPGQDKVTHKVVPYQWWEDKLNAYLATLPDAEEQYGIIAVSFLEEKSLAYEHSYTQWGKEKPMWDMETGQPVPTFQKFREIMLEATFTPLESRWELAQSLFNTNGDKVDLTKGTEGLREHFQKREQIFRKYPSKQGVEDMLKVDSTLTTFPQYFLKKVAMERGKAWDNWQEFKQHCLVQVQEEKIKAAKSPVKPSYQAGPSTAVPRDKKQKSRGFQSNGGNGKKEKPSIPNAKARSMLKAYTESQQQAIFSNCWTNNRCFFCGGKHGKGTCTSKKDGKPPYNWNIEFPN